MSAHLDFLPKNEQYVQSFDKGHLPIPPSKKLLILTCMDARIDAFASLGLDLGQTHVVRNAGGRAKDAIRSIIISQRLLGTREIAVFHHYRCGMLLFTSPELREIIKKDAGTQEADVAKTVDETDFLEISDVVESVKSDVEFLKEHPLLLKETKITGWTYNVEDGKIVQVA